MNQFCSGSGLCLWQRLLVLYKIGIEHQGMLNFIGTNLGDVILKDYGAVVGHNETELV